MGYLDSLLHVATQGPTDEEADTIKRLARVAGSTNYDPSAVAQSSAPVPNNISQATLQQPPEMLPSNSNIASVVNTSQLPDVRSSNVLPFKPFEPSALERQQSDYIQQANALKPEPSMLRRVLGDIAGGVVGTLGANPMIGIKTAEAIKRAPYNQQVGDLEAKSGRLSPLIKQEEERTREANTNYRSQIIGSYNLAKDDNADNALAEKAREANMHASGIGSTGILQKRRYEINGKPLNVNFDPKTGKHYDNDHNEVHVPKDALWLPPLTNLVARNSNSVITLPNALARVRNGEEILGEDGTPLDEAKIAALIKVDPNQVLNGRNVGSKLYFTAASPKQQKITDSNVNFIATPYNMAKLGESGADAPARKGQNRVGTAYTPPGAIRNAEGDLRDVPGTSVPMTGRSSGNVSGAASGNGISNNNTLDNVSGSKPVNKEVRVSIAQDKDLMEQGKTARVILSGLVGDPENPADLPLSKYVKLLGTDAKNPTPATHNIGAALRALMTTTDQMVKQNEGNSKGWGIGGNLGSGPLLPVSVGVNGRLFGTNMSHHVELSPQNIEKLNSTTEEILKKLNPEERRAVIVTLNAIEKSMPMRKILKSPNAVAAMEQIKATLPMIGVNVFTQDSFNTALKTWLNDGKSITRGIPPNYVGQSLLDRLYSTGDTSTPAPSKWKVKGVQ